MGYLKRANEASYSVAHLIAKSGASELIETLVKSVVKEMAQGIFGDKASKAIDCVSLSNKTVHHRITY